MSMKGSPWFSLVYCYGLWVGQWMEWMKTTALTGTSSCQGSNMRVVCRYMAAYYII